MKVRFGPAVPLYRNIISGDDARTAQLIDEHGVIVRGEMRVENAHRGIWIFVRRHDNPLVLAAFVKRGDKADFRGITDKLLDILGLELVRDG